MLCSERLRNAMNKRPVSVGQVCTNSWIQEILFYKKKSSNFSGIRSAADFNGVNPGRPTNGHPWRNSPEVILFSFEQNGGKDQIGVEQKWQQIFCFSSNCVFFQTNFVSPRGRAELARQGSLADRQFIFSLSQKFLKTSG